jgi:hypothetical protein
MSNLRYEVRDEWGGLVRRFYTRDEAETYIEMDKSLWIKTLPKPAKIDAFANALKRLGNCLF